MPVQTDELLPALIREQTIRHESARQHQARELDQLRRMCTEAVLDGAVSITEVGRAAKVSRCSCIPG